MWRNTMKNTYRNETHHWYWYEPRIDATARKSECNSVHILNSNSHVTPHVYFVSIITKETFE